MCFLQVTFAVTFNGIQTGAWWLLFILAVAFGLYRRRVVSRAWRIYLILVATALLTGLQTSAYLAYAIHIEEGHSYSFLYGLFLVFFHLARSSFLAVLLVISSGFW
jgi:hypothetical protein